MKNYINDLKVVLDKLDFKKMEELIRLIKKSNIVWVIGNGGSCSAACHFCVDLIKMCFKRAVAVTDASLLTMASNDESQENMFLYPLTRLVEKEDLVIGISIGGKSKNVLNVLEYDVIPGDKFLITGLGGKDVACNKLVLESENYQLGEDACLTVLHTICRYYGSVN